MTRSTLNSPCARVAHWRPWINRSGKPQARLAFIAYSKIFFAGFAPLREKRFVLLRTSGRGEALVRPVSPSLGDAHGNASVPFSPLSLLRLPLDRDAELPNQS